MESAQIVIALARAVYYVAIIVMFGAAVFPFYVGHRASVGMPRWLTPVLAVTALLALIAWLVAFTASLDGLGELMPTLGVVLLESSFGTVWLVRLMAAFMIVLATFAQLPRSVIAASAAVLLICEGWSGHAVAWGTLGSVNFALHSLCAAFWLGGLLPLFQLMRSAHRGDFDLQDTETALRRFSAVATVAVAGVVATGVINTWHMLARAPSFADLYVRVLTFKIVLVIVMIGMAGLNRYQILPRLRTVNRAVSLHWLVRSVAAEQLIGLLVLIDVSVLGTMNPHA